MHILFCFMYLLLLVWMPVMTSPVVIMSNARETYVKRRELFLQAERKYSLGATLELNDDEQKINETLMTFKQKELEEGFENPTIFAPARSFLEAVDDINKSEVFKILRQMPKGAMLHGHDTALVSADFVIKNITYRDNLYAKLNKSKNDLLELRFFQTPPTDDQWKSVKDMRADFGDSKMGTNFDEWLKTKITLGKSDVGLDVNTVWQRFSNIFGVIEPMLTYEPVWKDYFYQTLKEFHDDNINYLEFRGTLPDVYTSDGSILSKVQTCQLYVNTLNKFKEDNPSFFGAKFIYAPHRLADEQQFLEYIRIARDLKTAFPDFIAGFDLVGQEDLGHTLYKYSEELQELENEMNFYFHAGETDWNGFSTDDNLVDAVLLGTKRIGHGYAITKHPKVGEIVKKEEIGIEICPISNQVLGLVSDIRNHPATYLIRNNYPIVISADDPGFWGASGVSYDWYEAFMGLAAKWQDLQFLKQLAINSINQSSLDEIQKDKLYEDWELKWNTFIRNKTTSGVLNLKRSYGNNTL